jgi:hypothetical protein
MVSDVVACVWSSTSSAVIVYVVAAEGDVGRPETTPVAWSIRSPAGRALAKY